MRIGLQTWGSHGDVAPFIALAATLSARGHAVTLAVTTDDSVDYSAQAEAAGFELIIARQAFEHAPARALRRIVATRNPIEEVRLLNRHYFDPVLDEMYAAARALSARSDVVIGHFWLHPLLTAAELAGVPRVALHFSPLGVRSDSRPPAGPSLGRRLNAGLWNLGDRLSSRLLFRSANRLRVAAGLPPVTSLQRELFVSKDLTLIAASPLLVPRAPDWAKSIEVTGHFDTRLAASRGAFPAGLETFLAAGDAPVFMTFGSCDLFYAETNAALFIEAAQRAGVRAIVQTRARPAGGAPDSVAFVGDVDHPRVFPRARAVVHHGGAGTTHTTLAAGRPAIVVEHGFDQAHWGRALAKAGVAPPLLHRRSVSPAALASAIRRAVEDPRYAANARTASRALDGDRGLERAAELIESRFG